jgi:hypothetical protein
MLYFCRIIWPDFFLFTFIYLYGIQYSGFIEEHGSRSSSVSTVTRL